ncbi:hydroxymethylglutaryl-CoA reductase, degradative [Luteimonas fraxinea]|uniref:3-hydroxy-3-methylglutaryl coenzyme A reductase n=1 Tax=Luteimonas fraxinea TaxID=2901869 RepID=A0ABS8UBN0_9GAMM|nr:hydroxymethylglutaryl-CoA reductase, degradative [Luteimonas fraxinea]MCD9096464.1 hydroxymethylglutaryl-CoA reductase, degradative [Luteimonas fraxinea]MCD9125805.1 hydroxymethylglutaryl-CoA reductase, degradative [Luteimonas fraxinea]UHH10094.1 hydroxymethylglutaryl-CoA reductase, degradative [Luteimonas fraxinea]
MHTTSRIPGFYKLAPDQRFQTIVKASGLQAEQLDALREPDPDMAAIADRMIENAVGTIAIPLGIAANFLVNGVDYLVPMATEEPSVIAAASNAALIARELGGFHASSMAPVMIAQVQILDVADPQGARLRLLEAREELLALANAQDPLLVRLGGGARDIQVRLVDAGPAQYVVLHLQVDVRDAMGANAVNTMAEALAPRIAEIARGRSLLRILSNKADLRLVRVRAVYDAGKLGGADVVDGIVDAYRFAAADSYRAATHNKGIMNGISAVVLATGNDTRAIEAGAHCHACQNGRYTSLSHFEKDADGNLVATLELPLALGLVGGATKTHPTAQAAVKLLGVQSAVQLAEVTAAVGLAQNTAALRALATEGIQRGHMSLHARNVAVAAGAQVHEIAPLVERLVADGHVRQDRAQEILAALRRGE